MHAYASYIIVRMNKESIRGSEKNNLDKMTINIIPIKETSEKWLSFPAKKSAKNKEGIPTTNPINKFSYTREAIIAVNKTISNHYRALEYFMVKL
jgi:hypothetical protein